MESLCNSRLRAIYSGLPIAKRRKRRVVVFQAFFDDSGSGLPVFVLSGYVSRVDWWESFSDEWQSILDEPPKLPYFKMREAANCFGGRLTPDQRDRRVLKLFKLIRVAAHAAVSCVIPIQPFNRIMKGHWIKEGDDPYFIAIFDLVTTILENQINAVEKEPVDLVFDDNPRLAAKVPYFYQLTRDSIAPNQRRLMGASPRFEDDKQFLPLQACDAQSWYFRRLFAEKLNNEPFSKNISKELFAELDRVPAMMSFWSPERMQLSVETFERRKSGENIPHRSGAPKLRRFVDIHDLVENANLT